MTKQYEPCDHRFDTCNPDRYYSARCPTCTEASDFSGWAAIAVCALAVIAAVWSVA